MSPAWSTFAFACALAVCWLTFVLVAFGPGAGFEVRDDQRLRGTAASIHGVPIPPLPEIPPG